MNSVATTSYYRDKIDSLADIFGTDRIEIEADRLIVAGCTYPVVDDVILLSPSDRLPESLRTKLACSASPMMDAEFSSDIQATFGQEWSTYGAIMPEHESEFRRYFDLVDRDGLKNSRICDLGCGNGRWSYFLRDACRELVLVDFSDAIFMARKNLASSNRCLFFLCDLTRLPFRDDFADLICCLGVLHHLPEPCLRAVRNLKRYSPRLLCFLYYSLDNRPIHFRLILRIVTLVRKTLCRIHHPKLRSMIARSGTHLLYRPLIAIGALLDVARLGRHVPLYDFYRDKSSARIEQDVYDRFFTRIEQRVSRSEIRRLDDTFSRIIISEDLPYWHFICER